jgi:uncharacterized protein (DUF1501 family)
MVIGILLRGNGNCGNITLLARAARMLLLRPSRRQLLTAGAVGWLGLPQLLRAERATPRAAKSCIFIYQYGGLSQLDSWDPKPNAPEELRGPYKPIATSVPGFQVGELMPQLAKRADKYAVIRSMSHGVPIHDVANRMLLAGQSKPEMNATPVGAMITKLKPPTENVPAHVWLQKFGGGAMPPEPTYVTGGMFGPSQSPLVNGNSHADNLSMPGYRVRALETAADVSADRVQKRLHLLSDMAPKPASNGLDRYRERAADLLTGTKAREAFDIEREPASMRDRYGRNPLGQNLLLARRLIEAGVRLVSVVAWTGLAPGDKFLSIETWDMHGNAGVSIFGNGWNGLGWALPRCDIGVSALIDDLEVRGLLDSTLVVLVGEFGRTPRISKGGSAIGRDHWPNAYSAMLAGGGVRGGTIYGASDRTAAYVKDRPVSPEDFGATVLHALDIPPETRLSPDGFTLPASTGRPVVELF